MRVRIAALAVAASVLWLSLLLFLGVGWLTLRPQAGVLSRTFQGWSEFPASRHLYLGQYSGTEFVEGRAYVSYPYPLLFANFALVAPLHYAFDLSYERAHNVLPYIYAACLFGLLWMTTREEWSGSEEPIRMLFLALAVGLVVTSPLQWTSLLLHNRDNVHVLAAAAFCYLSTFVFHDRVPGAALMAIGIFLALWSPWYVPAWILAALFFRRDLSFDARWVAKLFAVCALGALNLALPRVICRLAGIEAVGSGLRFRTGLDGDTLYFTSIQSAVLQPVEPRHWPLGLYVIVAIAAAMGVHYLLHRSTTARPLAQIAFLAIPYATMAILLPQFTSIHPYFTDLLLIVPVTFVLAFWSMQREVFQRLTARSAVVYFLVAALVLMTNLLTVAQAAK
ncbi:MAG: hypothetical protein ACJ74H_02160 [Thermoanaerobaculia bacterium]